MRFFRSSEANKPTRSKSRFSFRRHSDDDADLVQKPPAHTASQVPRKHHSHSQPSAAAPPRPPAHPATTTTTKSSLRSTFVSSASTSASSSITSPSAIQRATRQSDEDTTARTTDTNSEDLDGLCTPSESSFLATTPRESMEIETPSPIIMKNTAERSESNSSIARTNSSSSSSNNGGLGSRSSSQRHSLVGYRQFEFSMSYKNRKTLTDDPLVSTNNLRASFNSSRRSDMHVPRSSNSNGTRDSFLSLIDEMSPRGTSSANSSTVPSVPLVEGRMSDVRLNEASVAALQTRRAFQQMVLALEDDESSDYDSDSEDRYSFGGGGGGGQHRLRHRQSSDGSGGIVHVGADDYRKFQYRLNQLEELCQDQARKQAHMEQTIETEVQQRTAKVVEAMEKKIAMYKQAKDLEVEREIQRRMSGERSSSNSFSTPPRESSFFHSGGNHSFSMNALPPQHPSLASSSSSIVEVDLKGKPLDKIFHPRRTRRRMEILREREEQQKKEMEQFREFIRSTEMRSTIVTRQPHQFADVSTARESIAALRDPHITEDVLAASPNELVEMICVLRKHVSVQETQLDEAKKLISAAIEAREDAEETAREAVELTMELDSRLERASQEMVELQRRSSEFYMDRNSQFSASFLRASSSSAASNLGNSQHLNPSFPR